MTAASPLAALASFLQDRFGTSDLGDPAVLAAVEGVLGHIAVGYQSRVAALEAELARRDAVDRYRQALAQACAILQDRSDLVLHSDLAAEMILRGVALVDVKIRMADATTQQ